MFHPFVNIVAAGLILTFKRCICNKIYFFLIFLIFYN
ncbi:hypothetical protein CLOBOL_00857 [Enterocloster bolteae ATCC BAA-613]|uniref:Uncharacterized protein n=1 Tax=Enterocloster bolteae (strain ATCC BAA-613 / DSM 15670 / CCUG 46953 / JCM 12243 / WAL 16351) TaxID=411902 RepID=A8RJ21_ENTBW|nr:hypothetical protein CLOBOL_00857 [Enterocloster bolteae ATCC BAA-613]